MTRAYYFRTFGKLSASDEDKKLLLIDRGIDKSRFIPGDNYIKSTLGAFTFEDSNDTTRYSSRIAHEGKHSFMMNSNNQFSPGIDITYNNLSSKEYLWIFASAWVFIPIENDDTINPVLVASFHHRGNPYEFCTSDENPPIEKGKWTQLHLKYLSPEIWNKRKDNLKVYIWYKGTKPIYVDDLVIDKYEPK